jgi:putative transposase
MARSPRIDEPGLAYHVLNRGNGRMRLFHKDDDFAAFERVLGQGLDRYPVDLLTYCLMHNHWHLILMPREPGAIGRLMRWVGVTHVRRHHEHYHTRGGGHLYQGRYKSFPIEADDHLLVGCRYVEGNPVRAEIVEHARDWAWSGMRARTEGTKPFKPVRWPVAIPRNWESIVDRPMLETELSELRTLNVNRGRPLGSVPWVRRTAERLGLMATLRPLGRPRKEENE